jgi:O-antigen/teichoic acid export membrane protein
LLGAQWLAIGFVGAVSLLLSILIARRFGPEVFGVYAQAVTLGTFLAILIDGGFGRLLMREAAATTPVLARYADALHGFAFGHMILAMGVLVVVAVVFPWPLHAITLLATVAAYGLAVMGNLSLAILRGQGRLVRDAAWQIFNRTLIASAIVLALWLGASSPWVVLGAQALGSMVFLFFLLRKTRVSTHFRLPRQVYAAAFPLVWLDLATAIYFKSDMLLFKFLGVPKADVGAYGVAFRLIEAFLLLATPVSLMLFRHFRLSAISASSATFYQIFRVAVLASGIGLTICGIAFLSASWFFITVFGEDFALAGDLFVVLSLMLVFALANGVLGQGVFALGLDRQYLVTATLAAVFNVSANICLMPRFGVWAAAWLTVATELVLAMGLVVALTIAWKKKNYGETSLE